MFNYDSMKGKTIVAVQIHCIDCGREMGMREGGSRSSVYYVCEPCGEACYFHWENGFYPLSYETEKE